ncbi:hypothetical protein BH10ACI4_BH10ACI4_29020 [soil metagenome]
MFRLIILVTIFVFSRSLVSAEVPGVVIDHQPPASKQYIGSPSIVRAPDGTLIASHDLFGPGSTSTVSAVTRLFLSHDNGVTWKQSAEVQDQFWSNLFVLKARVFLMGTTAEYGRIVIRTSEDNGAHWSAAHYLTQDDGYHTAPVPIIVKNGRIYRAFEFHPKGAWGNFQAFMMSASVNSDLTDAASWTKSNRLPYPATEAEGTTFLEGNAVVTPDGNIVDILRVANISRVAILPLTGDHLAFKHLVDFPGGATKFSIRFDPTSRLYWTLSNPALPGEELAVSSPASVRNTLALMSSSDLVKWTPRKIVLHHNDSVTHAFQYVDWQFDGKDLILASRTAADDDQGFAHTYHDANYLTFHRVVDFRHTGHIVLSGSAFTSAEVVSAEQMKKAGNATRPDAENKTAGVASTVFGKYGNHTTTLTTRVQTGEAEQHQDWSDIFVIVSGEATLLSGRSLISPRSISIGEVRGSGVQQGKQQNLTAGSVVHISPKVAHQMLLSPGSSVTYFVVKVKARS